MSAPTVVNKEIEMKGKYVTPTTEPDADVVERVADAIRASDPTGTASCADLARAALSVLSPSDAERKLAAVRELRDATAALCKPPAPTDDDPMSQGAWAARWEVVNALNALLDGEVES